MRYKTHVPCPVLSDQTSVGSLDQVDPGAYICDSPEQCRHRDGCEALSSRVAESELDGAIRGPGAVLSRGQDDIGTQAMIMSVNREQYRSDPQTSPHFIT